MRDTSGPGPSASPPTALRALAAIGFVFVGLALVLRSVSCIQHGELKWRGFVTSLGIGLLLIAFFLGPRRRALYYALLVTSIALLPISFLL
jgi:hypothetical protein